MDTMHATTNATLFWGLYWVSHAAANAFLLTALLAAPFYLGPFVRRAFRRLMSRHRPAG